MNVALGTAPERPAATIVLCRFGEIFLKGANRGRFARVLVDNIRHAVADLPGTRVTAPHGRVLVAVPAAALEEACARLARVFGLVSVSPARSVAAEMTEILAASVEQARLATLADPSRARAFKVEARRSDKRFAFGSHDIAREAGARIAAATGLPVDLHDPSLIVGIEVGSEVAFVFCESRPGPGGLPVGVSGRALLLLSGGIDSPAAGWLAAKRGLSLDAVYFHSPPFVGEKSRDKVVALGRQLGRWQALHSLFVAPFTETQKQLREAGPPELAVALYRRMMMRVADLLADRAGATALVTGESLGQVASQTLPNLSVIEQAARRLVLRPLVTYDKSETIALARRIGTYETSVLPYEDCCTLFVPAHPATAARLVDAQRAEKNLDLAAMAAAVAGAAEEVRVDGRGPGPDAMPM
jgi:tRNA uracil 4-sulfurtransferase